MLNAAAVMERHGQKASRHEKGKDKQKGSGRAHRASPVSRVRHETRVLRHADRKCRVILQPAVMPSHHWMKMARRFWRRRAILRVI